jgi:hypothetical protein
MLTGDNRGKANKDNDTWLTPPAHVAALGPFDLDPCAAPSMPWRTAERQVVWREALPAGFVQQAWEIVGDGLEMEWTGRVFCNPPFSAPLDWVEKMADHDNGIILLPGKSPDTKWGQLLLATADMVLYPRGRFAFHYPDGTVSKGKWNPMIYAAYGEVNVSKLVTFESTVLPGILMESIGSRGMAELREKYDY